MGSSITYHSNSTANQTSNNQASDPGVNSVWDAIAAFFNNLNVSIDESGTRITDKLGTATIEYFSPSKSFAKDERFQATMLQETTKLKMQLWVMYALVGIVILFLFLKRR